MAVAGYALYSGVSVSIPYATQADAARDQVAYAQDIFNAVDHPAKKRGR